MSYFTPKHAISCYCTLQNRDHGQPVVWTVIKHIYRTWWWICVYIKLRRVHYQWLWPLLTPPSHFISHIHCKCKVWYKYYLMLYLGFVNFSLIRLVICSHSLNTIVARTDNVFIFCRCLLLLHGRHQRHCPVHKMRNPVLCWYASYWQCNISRIHQQKLSMSVHSLMLPIEQQ